jgi:transglutaminase-like putative cysteine protease
VIGARRIGFGTFWTAVISIVALAWYCAFIFRRRDLFYGLPSRDALIGLWNSIRSAYEKSTLDYAPVPVRPGYVMLSVIGMWLATSIGEIATFRWRRPFIAIAPPIALFALLSIVGTRTGTTFLVIFFIGTLLSYLALESSHRLRSWGSWITSLADRNAETPGEVSSRLARRMGVSCLAAAVFSPLFLPAIGDGLLSWRNNSGVGPGSGSGGGGGEVDLLASLQPRILEQSQAPMFTVDAARADYWRLTSLVNFDGTIWTPLLGQPTAPLLGDTVVTTYTPTINEPLTQRVRISGLRGEHLPAATQPATVAIPEEVEGRDNQDLSSEPETGTVKIGGGLVEELGYEVTSITPTATFKDLNRTAVGEAPAIYVDEGPIAIDPEVESLIEDWTGRFDTPFKKLVALQDNLRTFTYSIDVDPAASTNQLSDFLLETRRGYCQQFAAAFALIARHMGFPTRVSIGFLPGETDLAEPTHFVVKGTDAHAWPEVLFEDYGWVRFEPTPGNGAAPPRYTSRALPFRAQNAFSDLGTNPDGTNPGSLAENLNVPVGGRDRGGPVPTRERGRNGQGSDWERTFSTMVTFVLLALFLFILCVPLLKALRTAISYRSARTPESMAAAAFSQFEREAADLASSRDVSESASGFARRMGVSYKVPNSNALELAAIYERAAYARDGIDGSTAARAKRLAATLRNELWASATLMQRAKRLFSPASLMGN